MRIVIIIQARMASTRLPGKVMLPVAGEPMLARMLERVARSRAADGLVVATTEAPDDDAIVTLCRRRDIEVFRGHSTDCLQRHLDAGRTAAADAVVKIPSDCPMIDPAVIDCVVDAYRGGSFDYVGNLHPGSWPDGNDVEVISMDALERAARSTDDPFDREHTTPFIWSNPQRFALHNVRWDAGLDYSRSHRWVVDWQADYEFVCACFEALYPRLGAAFGVQDVLELLERRPALAEHNAAHRHYDYRLTRDNTDSEPAPTKPHAQSLRHE